MAHKEIWKLFEVDGRRFAAVGFLNEGESPVSGDEMFRRVPNAIGEEDANFLAERCDRDWSKDLWQFNLATVRRLSADPRQIQCFYRRDDRWHSGWNHLGFRYHEKILVVCRCWV